MFLVATPCLPTFPQKRNQIPSRQTAPLAITMALRAPGIRRIEFQWAGKFHSRYTALLGGLGGTPLRYLHNQSSVRPNEFLNIQRLL